MKTVKLIFIIPAFIFSNQTLKAINPVGTYTLVPPCQPFAVALPVSGTSACYSFTATNGGIQDVNGYYSWTFGDGTSAIGTPVVHCYSPTVNSGNTIYQVTVTYNSTLSCSPSPLHQTFTVQASLVTTDVKEKTKEHNPVILYPNPANTNITIQAEQSINTITILDYSGTCHYRQQHIKSNHITIPVSTLPLGLYILQLSGDDKLETHLKFTKN